MSTKVLGDSLTTALSLVSGEFAINGSKGIRVIATIEAKASPLFG